MVSPLERRKTLDGRWEALVDHSDGEASGDSAQEATREGSEGSLHGAVAVKLGRSKSQTAVTLDTTAQHTLVWNSELKTADGEVLAPGSLNLYVWPGPFRDAALAVVIKLMFVIASSPLMEEKDSVGAFPIHGLLVANTDDSLEVAFAILARRPALLMQVHGDGPFIGESALHVLCANQREKHAERFVDLARQYLRPEQFATVLKAQTHGAFFDAHPMVFYGSSPLSYACVFGLKSLVLKLLETDLVRLDQDHCVVCGLLPLHAVTANGLTDMYNFLRTLPPKYRPSSEQLTCDGRVSDHDLSALSPLQIACRLGQSRMLKHVLKREKTNMLWKWGSVSAFQTDLAGIDSSGAGARDCLEIVADLDASEATQSFLLDSFMQGFLYRLLKEKWNKYGSKLHYAWRLLDCALLLAMTLVTVLIKYDPVASELTINLLIAVVCVLVVLSVGAEMYVTKLYMSNCRARLERRALLDRTWRWMQSFDVPAMLIASALTLLALYIHYQTPNEVSASFHFDGGVQRGGSGEGRFLKDHGGGFNDNGDDVELELVQQAKLAAFEGIESTVWLLLAIACLIKFVTTASSLLMPFEDLSVLILNVRTVMQGDLAVFMCIFIIAMASCYFVLLIIYPQHPQLGRLPQVAEFHDWWVAGVAVLHMGLVGEPLTLSLDPAAFSVLGLGQQTNLCFFYIFYFIYIVFTLILLLNLLIAVLGNSFSAIQEATVLQGRVAFARVIIRLELLAMDLGMYTNGGTASVGADAKTRYLHEFRVVGRTSRTRTCRSARARTSSTTTTTCGRRRRRRGRSDSPGTFRPRTARSRQRSARWWRCRRRLPRRYARWSSSRRRCRPRWQSSRRW